MDRNADHPSPPQRPVRPVRPEILLNPDEAHEAIHPRIAEPDPVPLVMPIEDTLQLGLPPARDRIVVLGRRGSGKTIFLARLYEALWQGATLVNGYVARAGEPLAGRETSAISCRTTSGAVHTHFMGITDELRKGRWPSATLRNAYAELVVTLDGREHVVTALDYPGEVFRKAFMLDSDESDAVELRNAVDRAAAAILLIDPNVVASGGPNAEEDVFGLTQAALRIRRGENGSSIPIAIVMTKTDQNAALLREAGGVKQFASKHFGPLFREIDRTSVFACAAVRTTQNALGRPIPRMDKPPENVVEPLHYCLDFIERSEDADRSRAARAERRAALQQAEHAEHQERKKTAMAWVVFAVAVSMLLVSVGVVAFWLSMRQ